MKGSIEIITASGENLGTIGTAIDVASVPSIVAALHGYTGFSDTEPEERANRMPVAEWTASDPDGLPVTVILWEEREWTATEVGQAIVAAAAQLAEQQG